LSEGGQLVNYDAARAALQKAHRVDEVKLIRDWAESMRAYAKQANDTEMQTLAVKIKLRATRRLGEVGKQQRDKGEIAKKSQGRRKRNSDNIVTVSKPTLKELGIDRRLSAMGAKLAAIPESKFEAIVAETGIKEELTSAGVLRVAVKAPERAAKQARIAREARAGGQALPTGTLFPVILADCPWQYKFVETDSRAVDNHYPPMSIDELCVGVFGGVDVRTLFATDCVIFFWATAPKLREAFRVLDAWGFDDYRTNFVWDKEKIGMGYWCRGQHEHLLVAIRGNFPAPLAENRVSSVIREPRGAHSEKPIAVYEIIERYFPDLPKLELFSRTDREGWVSWGNQLNMAALNLSTRANESEQAPVRTQ
jgi:N6-adenosine-specific RNA methylase IME4